MHTNNRLALVIAYYLSKFDNVAYNILGFQTSTDTHAEIGRILGVNANSIKNMRDEFDPLHANPRAGWYQRPLRPSRAKVVQSFQHLSEEELRDIALEILTNPAFVLPELSDDVPTSLPRGGDKGIHKPIFVVRGPTGRKAEEHFIAYHSANGIPAKGNLKDTRDHGCGYDFAIITTGKEIQIEVKGLDGEHGGISFTSKEWDTARTCGETYYLVIVRNTSSDPHFQFIQNPYEVLTPRKSVYTTVQVQWNVLDSDLPHG